MNDQINQNNLEKLINMGDKLSLADLFNPNFISKHTDFETIQALIKESGYDIKTEEDFKDIPDEEWDQFIAEKTQFDSWKTMQIKAFEVFTDNILLS